MNRLAVSVLVYRDSEQRCDTASALAHVQVVAEVASRNPTRDATLDLIIEVGEFEAAVADRMFPDRDGVNPLERRLRAASLAASHALLAAYDGDRSDRYARATAEHLSHIAGSAFPETIALRVSEGYAYYALHPCSYAASARRFAETTRAALVRCIGIRSIGTSLSAVVGAALERRGLAVELYTVRPHGHPFSRMTSIRDDLATRLRDGSPGAVYLVIDEGPGLSGSSFASVAQALVGLGVSASQIVFFSSWDADGSSFNSGDARTVWQRHARFAAQREPLTGGIDWSGGAWRRDVLGADECDWPAVQPQHEAEKRWLRSEGIVVRFAGFGRYGRAKLARANALAAHGLGASPHKIEDGYLTLEFVEGTVCRRTSTSLCDAIARHVAFLTRDFPSARTPDLEQLEAMIATNLAEGIGDVLIRPAHDDARRAVAEAPAALIDGRMLPHEWIHTSGRGWTKVDALDHHADHFFPGAQDAGWDLAAAAFEFGMDSAARERLVAGYVALSGDRDVRVRLPFYDLAYPAFRLGYATLAAQSVCDPAERGRFARVAARCRERVTSPSGL